MLASIVNRGSLRVFIAVALLWLPAARASDERSAWVGTWATGPAGPGGPAPRFNNQTVRYIVHTSVAGNRVRVRISNTFGADPITIGTAHVARRNTGSSIVSGTDRALTFSGNGSFTIPAGGLVLSDPTDLDLPALSDLAVSIYFPGNAAADTMHIFALQTSYIAAGHGDSTAATSLPGATTTSAWHFLTGVEVTHEGNGAAVVAFGDSITDGAFSTPDANGRWPDILARRLQARRELSGIGVLSQGVIGNRILHPSEAGNNNLFAPAALARFDRDVLAQAGVRYLIVLLGINDIGHPGDGVPLTDEVTAEQIEAGLRQMVVRAHEKGIKVMGATMLPFENTTIPGFYSPQKEVKRQAVNHWIRTSHAFDAVVDFDAAVRDPSHPARMLPAYDSGDHLHPSPLGHQVMGNAISLEFFDDD